MAAAQAEALSFGALACHRGAMTTWKRKRPRGIDTRKDVVSSRFDANCALNRQHKTDFLPFSPSPPLLPDEVAFQKHLRTKVLGRQFEFYYSLASTMETAKLALNAAHTKPSALHGKIIMADRQTAGIGRRGRGWTSDPEGNIYISLIYAPPGFENKSADLLREMMKLNLAISVATARACHAAGVHAARVKWPNDVWIKGKKVSGMLVNFDGRAAAIAGIGINVNQVRRQWRGKSARCGLDQWRCVVLVGLDQGARVGRH